MEAVSIHYPSTCQLLCKGAAVHRRPANWFDTGEKWCMIALANLSLSGCQVARAWGHCYRIKTLISSLSKGFTPVLLSWVWPACCWWVTLPWPHSLFEQTNKRCLRGSNLKFVVFCTWSMAGRKCYYYCWGGWLRRAETAGGESQLKMEKLFWTSWGGGEVRIAVLLVGTLKEVKLNPGNTVWIKHPHVRRFIRQQLTEKWVMKQKGFRPD